MRAYVRRKDSDLQKTFLSKRPSTRRVHYKDRRPQYFLTPKTQESLGVGTASGPTLNRASASVTHARV